MAGIAERPRIGTLLRGWRERRRMSQLDLGLEAGAFFPADEATAQVLRGAGAG